MHPGGRAARAARRSTSAPCSRCCAPACPCMPSPTSPATGCWPIFIRHRLRDLQTHCQSSPCSARRRAQRSSPSTKMSKVFDISCYDFWPVVPALRQPPHNCPTPRRTTTPRRRSAQFTDRIGLVEFSLGSRSALIVPRHTSSGTHADVVGTIGVVLLVGRRRHAHVALLPLPVPGAPRRLSSSSPRSSSSISSKTSVSGSAPRGDTSSSTLARSSASPSGSAGTLGAPPCVSSSADSWHRPPVVHPLHAFALICWTRMSSSSISQGRHICPAERTAVAALTRQWDHFFALVATVSPPLTSSCCSLFSDFCCTHTFDPSFVPPARSSCCHRQHSPLPASRLERPGTRVTTSSDSSFGLAFVVELSAYTHPHHARAAG